MLRRQQMRMLEILVEVDRICKKHNIRYWLSSGTLIGALRHNGFIPWDDDLDIEMMRSDYLRLMQILPSELPDWLALQNDETDPNYFYFYAKVRDRRSKMLEQNGYDRLWKEQGIYIDIFPMEQHPIWLHKLTEKSVGHMYKIWRTSTDDEKAIKSVRRIFNFNNRYFFPCLRPLPKYDNMTIEFRSFRFGAYLCPPCGRRRVRRCLPRRFAKPCWLETSSRRRNGWADGMRFAGMWCMVGP